ncbi:MAG TPA: TonB family protein [Thermoanaerobaculia bacterium]|nr:TonB family protein [Thermoanaerobaculia bacterium]
MFETSVVATAGASRPQHRAVLLTASVGVHTFIVVAAIAAGIQSISFPTTAPNQTEAFTPVIPVVIPSGGGGAQRAPEPPHPQAAARPPQQTAPAQQTAPQMVPDAIPNVAATSTADIGVGPAGPAGPAGPGDPNAIGIGPGPAGPSIGVGPATAEVPDVIFHAGADVKSAVVISRVAPAYPPIPLRMHMNGVVTVHCVIDRNGRIRDAEVVHTSSPLFNESALSAVKQWTFAPGTMHGTAVDTYFELTVTFSVK